VQCFVDSATSRRPRRLQPIAFMQNLAHLDPMDYDELLSANAAFYAAFSNHDIDSMSELWAQGDVSCIHPGWLVIVGHDAVISSYRDIFRNPRQEPIVTTHETPLISGVDGRVFCVESVGPAMLAATNWFRLVDGMWRLIHHQASQLVVAPPTVKQKQSFH
jgi:SnoaL-like domain